MTTEIRKRGRPRTHPLIPEAARLVAWRERYGLTQQQAAERLCLSRETLEGWERGRFAPPKHLANYLRLVGAELERERAAASP